MNVLFLSPQYPPEMAHFCRGLRQVGAHVFGVGDSPVGGLDPQLKQHLDDYLQVPSIMDEEDVQRRVHAWLRGRRIDRVESVWEPLVLLAAKLREAFGVDGMSVDTVMGFRDKQLMKERVAAAGLRVPKSYRCTTEGQVREAAKAIGFPVIVKPVAGAGSADTHRVDDQAQLERVIASVRHVREVSCEEFVEGDEFTYDTICIDGRPVFENVAQYLPRPLVARTNEWISPEIITVRHLDQPELKDGIALGRGVLKALRMGSGFTHMEWYRKASGEVVFGEIGCRVGGARLIDQMNLTCDADLYREWARAVCWKSFEASTERKFNVAIIFKRAQGQGRITRIDGLDSFLRKYKDHVCGVELLPVGAFRRDWLQTLVSDGFVLLRHPDFKEARRMADAAATEIRMFAGG